MIVHVTPGKAQLKAGEDTATSTCWHPWAKFHLCHHLKCLIIQQGILGGSLNQDKEAVLLQVEGNAVNGFQGTQALSHWTESLHYVPSMTPFTAFLPSINWLLLIRYVARLQKSRKKGDTFLEEFCLVRMIFKQWFIAMCNQTKRPTACDPGISFWESILQAPWVSPRGAEYSAQALFTTSTETRIWH